MESLDPLKNIANVGISRRRISSILKAPRTSVHFADPEHVETPVEVAMPVEKRNSRRVSFAPATDVLLFPKEKKNGSPVPSPLQDLNAANTPDNRNPIGVIENGIQPITDMETLLNAPLHSSQQRKEVFMVSHDAEDHYGEKTMMFSADDAAMDVTHSHTVLITNDSDLPDQHDKMLSTCGNRDFLFPMDKGKAEPCILPKITSSSVHSFDPEFENFLASISKPSGPRDNYMLHKVEQNAPMMPHGKENQAPTLMSTQNFPDKTVKIRDSSNRGVVLSEDTQGMEMTDVFTGHIVENATADDPLQCLFPTPDMYRQSEQREPAEKNGRQQLKCSLSNPIDTRVVTKPSAADSKKCSLGAPSLKMGNSLSLNLTQTRPLPGNRLISQNKNAQHVLGLEEYANRSTSESDDMDMTKSQTVAIDSRSLHAVTMLTKQQQEISRFSITAPYKTSTDFENDMDFTRCQTGVIEAKNLDVGKPLFTGNAGGSVRIIADNQRDRAINQEKITIGNFEFDNMEITQSQTAVIESLHRVKPDLPDQHGEMLSTCGNMDFFFPTDKGKAEPCILPKTTSSSLRSFDPNFQKFLASFSKLSGPRDNSMLHKVEQNAPMMHYNEDNQAPTFMSTNGENLRHKTVKIEESSNRDVVLSEDTQGMEMTDVFTGNIVENATADDPLQCLFPTLDLYRQSEQREPAERNGRQQLKCSLSNPIDKRVTTKPSVADYKKFRFGAPSPKMGNRLNLNLTRTRPLPENRLISQNKNSQHVLGLEEYENRSTSESDDMDMTKSQTVAIDSRSLHAVTTLTKQQQEISWFSITAPCKTSTDFENDMDFTRCQTGVIEAKNLDVGKPLFTGNAGGSVRIMADNQQDRAVNQEKTTIDNFEFDNMEITQSQTAAIESLHRVKPLQIKQMSQDIVTPSTKWNNPSEDDDMEFTTCHTRVFETKDVDVPVGHVGILGLNKTLSAVDDCDAPLAQPKSASDGISKKTQLLSAPQHNPQTQMTDKADYTQQFAEEDQPCVTAPLNFNRKSLTSRLSLGNFLPKLPQVKRADPIKVSGSGRTSVEEHENKINSVNVTHQLSSGMIDNFIDEVLPNISSDEDLSGSFVTENPQSTSEDGSPLQERDVQGTSEEEVWKLSPGHPSVAQGKKRPSPVDGEDTMVTEKMRRPSLNSTIEMSPEKGNCIGTLPLAPAVMTQAIDASNSSNTAHLRSETTFESTLKQSLFESQLEGTKDDTNDFQKNVDDESITVLEFFKLFDIDFVIHNPRQSILPGKLASHLDHTPEELLKNKHINHPKQRVYELDHQNLAVKVERLKARMKDQGRLLHTVNKPLWEELICFSDEELKCFGAKLKENSNFFRKRSKAQSDEMKEVLYSNLLQATQEEQQKLREKLEEADGMLKGLDDCIQELETELAAVEGSGLDDSKPTLKSSQLELENVTVELADRERQMCEMEMQTKCNMDKVKRLQTETKDLNDHITMLHRVNEWTVAERRANCDVYSFLYGSLHLEVVFDTCTGPEGENERHILDINFKFALDEERSACHARLVHTVLSQFTKGQSDWVEKYPSNRCVPKLLHDVGLVVSRCRLLSEELRLLKTWGSLKFDILDIRCVDTRVHIVFSSLEAMAKFELSLGVTAAYPWCPLHMQDFKSHIGATTAHRIEEIVSSVSPGKNHLTRVVKAIHAAVLS